MMINSRSKPMHDLLSSPELIKHCATPKGKWILWCLYTLVFIATLRLMREDILYAMSFCLILVPLNLFPHYRWQILALSPLLWLQNSMMPRPMRVAVATQLVHFGLPANWHAPYFIFFLGIFGLFFCLSYQALIRLSPENSLIKRKPLTILLVTYFISAFIFSLDLLPTNLKFSFSLAVLAISPFLFFLAFDLNTFSEKNRLSGLARVGLYRPFWSIFFVSPIKGEAYLTHVESKNNLDLARSQLAGFRLLLWALAIKSFTLIYEAFIFTLPTTPHILTDNLASIGLITMQDALALVRAGNQLPTFQTWKIVYAEFFHRFLIYTFIGHTLISMVRMSGFYVYRNAYRPFESRSLNEFFGRYNYYFKELLLNVFYYPSYFQFFKSRPRLRIFFAVFASAGFGNLLVHFVRDIGLFLENGFIKTLIHFLPYSFYCFALATALSFSILFQLERNGEIVEPFIKRALRLCGIVSFFAVLRIFDDPFNGDISNNFALLAKLFGL